ncbi:MAG: lysophospholipid acyltransferase family protein [Fusobacteriaceae bacterium]
MLGTFIVIFTALFGLFYITIFKTAKLDKLDEGTRVKFSRNELKSIGVKILDRIKADVQTLYEDENDFKKLDPKQGLVFISNHTSNLDIPCLMKGVPVDLGFVAKKEMETWPFFGKWMTAAANVFIDRKNPREGIKSIKKAVEIVKKGHPIIIFPQGTRKAKFGTNEFKKGSFRLATEVGGVVVPIVIRGVSDIQAPNGSKINMNRKVTIYICKAIYLKNLSDEEIKGLDKIVEAKISKIYNS